MILQDLWTLGEWLKKFECPAHVFPAGTEQDNALTDVFFCSLFSAFLAFLCFFLVFSLFKMLPHPCVMQKCGLVFPRAGSL